MTNSARIREIQDPQQREHYVYRVFDAEGALLYIGCTNNPDRRWTEHRSDNPKWTSKAARFHLSGPYNYDTARRLEREALATENPQYGMTPQRRSAHTRNANLQRRYFDLYLEEGHDPREAGRLAIERAEREVPHPRVSARS